MPRFYFDVRDGDDLFVDNEGMDLADMDSATVEARQALADMMRDSLRSAGSETLSIAIRDQEDGPVLLTVSLTTSLQSGKTR